jgi:hypothetical protein
VDAGRLTWSCYATRSFARSERGLLLGERQWRRAGQLGLVGRLTTSAVIASLSLHYFAWRETVALVSRTRDALRSGGWLLCRLNSTEDHNHGASGHPPIEPSFYMVGGERKRFFDEKSVLELFATGWRRLSVEHLVTHKYAMPKALWEVVLERDA